MARCFMAFLFLICSFGQTNHSFARDTRIGKDNVDYVLEQSRKAQWINPDSSLNLADGALGLAQRINYKKGIAEALNLKGFCYWTFGDNDLAIQAALEALEIAQQENLKLVEAESYYILARGYMDLREMQKARESILKADALVKEGDHWEHLVNIYNLRGVIMFIDHQTDSALVYYNKAYRIGKDHAVDPINFPRIISNIGECHSAENPAIAFAYFTDALALAKETNNKIAEASITAIIGQAYFRENDIKNAETNLQAALELSRKLGLRRVVRQAYAGLVDIKLQQGKGDEAVVYLKRFYEVRDSLLNTSKVRQIVELEAKHELQLLESEARVQTIWKNLLIVLVIVLILLSAGLHQLQRYRYRKNREMLDLEIDYLTRQHKETVDRYKASIVTEGEASLESYDQKLLRKAIAIVETNISDPQLSVEKMASEMNMSRTSLHRKIKSITGFTPSDLIRSIRLRKAARLVVNKVDTVSQIALLVGFDDYSHFSKAFKKHFGVSPSNYEEHTKIQQKIEQESEIS